MEDPIDHRNMPQSSDEIRLFYRTLSEAWGPQHWWPAETPFEVIVGAILTQNTSWANVERAMANLRTAGRLSLEGIRKLPITELEQLIRSAGYFRQKSARLKNFIAFLDANYAGSLELLFSQPTQKLRAELLTLNGIGPETADSILLYAGAHEVFVVDAYTRRVFERHDLTTDKAKYEEIREMVERALSTADASRERSATCASGYRPQAHTPSAMSTSKRSPLAQRYNEFHGLIVQLGKHHCLKSEPKCETCPLGAALSNKQKSSNKQKKIAGKRVERQ